MLLVVAGCKYTSFNPSKGSTKNICSFTEQSIFVIATVFCVLFEMYTFAVGIISKLIFSFLYLSQIFNQIPATPTKAAKIVPIAEIAFQFIKSPIFSTYYYTKTFFFQHISTSSDKIHTRAKSGFTSKEYTDDAFGIPTSNVHS